jgi:hypothetical protein
LDLSLEASAARMAGMTARGAFLAREVAPTCRSYT